ncbi:MAG TPA: alpha/beta hydrolase [Candidatus Dormibacteraeota bacterium]|nr:alpha/beta hydrolase [Candidatus Dormibacteraeota bacterium]
MIVCACNQGPPVSPTSPTPIATTGSLVWYRCGGSFQCSSVTVPLDYSNPSRGTIDIAISRLPATNPSQRIGSLLINPGGPGASGVDYLRNRGLHQLLLLNRRFDLVSWDPRGVGRSSPVRCLTDKQRDANTLIDPVLDDPTEKQAYLQEAQALARACEQNSGSLLPYVDTASAARDMDIIRAALDESKVTYLGFSYGTFLGEVYAHLYPTHVRALVLDGVVDSTVPADQWLVQRAAGVERNLQAFYAYCRSRFGCLFGASGDPSGRLTAFLQRLETKPLPVRNRKLTRGMALTAILSYVVFPNAWDALSSALNAADDGDGSALMLIYDAAVGRHSDGTYTRGESDAATAINCLDDRPIAGDLATYDDLGTQLSAASPIFGPAFQYSLAVCSVWPVKPKHLLDLAVQGAPPILLVGADGDPLTPLSDAQAVSRRIPGSVVLTRIGVGHTSYSESACVQTAVNQYLSNLTLPASGTACESDATP